MPRTTLDIDAPVLRDLKRLQRAEKRPLGRIVSDLLVEALGRRRTAQGEAPVFRWTSRDMRARIDLADKEAVYAALDERER